MRVTLNITQPRERKLIKYVSIAGLILSAIAAISYFIGLIGITLCMIIVVGWVPLLIPMLGIEHYTKPFRLNGDKILLEEGSVIIVTDNYRKEYRPTEIQIHLDKSEDVGFLLVHSPNYGNNNYIKTPDGAYHYFYLKRQSDLF